MSVTVSLLDYDPLEHTSHVFDLLGRLHMVQLKLFDARDMKLRNPHFDLDDYKVDMIMVDDEVAGVILSQESHNFDEAGAIGDIVLYEKYWGHGYGKLAIKLVMSSMKAAGLKHVNLNVHADNVGAIRCYESCGFKPVSMFMTARLDEKSGTPESSG